jgi:hypothetical protein
VTSGASGQGTVNPDKGEVAQIQFQGNIVGNYECRIFLLTGEQVWQAKMENVSSGTFTWAPQDVSSGTYIASIIGPGLKVKKKIVVVK